MSLYDVALLRSDCEPEPVSRTVVELEVVLASS